MGKSADTGTETGSATKTGRQINPMLKTALELGPIILFFIGYMRIKDQTITAFGQVWSGFLVMTALFVAVTLIASGLLWLMTGRLSRMQGVTLVLVVIMGGLSLWLHDERFFKMKPTLIYLFFASALGVGLWRGESWLQSVMENALPMQPEGWMILTRRVAGMFLALAVANEVVWRSFSTEVWVGFKTFGLTAALFGFLLTQARLIERYSTDTATDTPKDRG